MKKQKILTADTETVSVLDTCQIMGNSVFLPDRLEPELYKKVNDVLTALGSKYSTKAKAHIFDYDIRIELQQVIATGRYNNWRKDTDFFVTPPEVLKNIYYFSIFDYEDKIRFLEPSAGKGDILDYVKEEFPNAELSAVEINPRHVQRLKDKGYSVLHMNFLEYTDESGFDFIIMNPPFSDMVNHIMHAYSLLRPNGQLISNTTSMIDRQKGWPEFVQDKYYSRLDLPTGSFKNSGTGVNSAMISLTKIEQIAAA